MKNVYYYAIKDMMAAGINPALLISNKAIIDQLNRELNIVVDKPRAKVKPKPAKRFIQIQAKPIEKPSIVYHRKVIINVDGTISIEFEEWDYK